MEPIKLMVADDHHLFRAGLLKLLSSFPEIVIIAEATDGTEAIQLSLEKTPDVILMDINMPGLNGVQAIKEILHHNPLIKIIVITTRIQPAFLNQVLQSGVKGYLSKNASLEKVIKAIKKVMMHEAYLDPELAQTLALKNITASPKHVSEIDILSKRELQILRQIAQGIEAADIAKELNISPKTVNTYRYRIYEKLNLSNDVEITLFYLKQQLLEAPTESS